MVCPRCVTAVSDELNKLDIAFETVKLGEVELSQDKISIEELDVFAKNISRIGFELIDDKNAKIVDKIKTLIIDYVHYKDINSKLKFSEYLKERLNYDYNYLSNLFSSVESTTIEQCLIKQKVERVKELLFYNQQSLSEISYQLGYSSVAHLSSQFKKITGMTPTAFKKAKNVNNRNNIDNL